MKKLFVGLRHSAIISSNYFIIILLIDVGDLYTFGSGNWGVLGHGNEKDSKLLAP